MPNLKICPIKTNKPNALHLNFKLFVKTAVLTRIGPNVRNIVAVVVGEVRRVVVSLVVATVVVAIVVVVVVVVTIGQIPCVILMSSIAMSPEYRSPLTPTNANCLKQTTGDEYLFEHAVFFLIKLLIF